MNDLLGESSRCLSSRRLGEAVGRNELMAFALLMARLQHFPSKAHSEDSVLLEKNKDIFEAEKDRCIKQRRIYIGLLAKFYSNL